LGKAEGAEGAEAAGFKDDEVVDTIGYAAEDIS
jgi:hypothetical protein